MGLQLANAERLGMEAMARGWSPPPPVDYEQWAEANVSFSAAESPFPGPFSFDRFPYLREILRALSPDDPCRFVTVKGSAQIGKTVIGNVFAGGSMDMTVGLLLYVHPTDDNASRWSKLKLRPMLRSTMSLSRQFPEKSRDGSDSVLYKERADGMMQLLISGANSPAALSQLTAFRQVHDDLSKWEINAAGDPETQADSRSRAVEFAKVLKISTPLIEPGCRISKNFGAGSQEHPYVPCPHAECGHMQVLEWANMLAGLDPEKPEDAHFTCSACGGLIEEHHRPAMLSKLEWRPHNAAAKREHRSFWIWSAYSYLQSFERIAREWLKAKGDTEAEKTFKNDTAGEAYEAAGEAPPWEKLRDRASQSGYARGQIPVGALVITVGIDCQADRVEWQAVGWGRDFRRFVVDYGVIPGHISDTKCQSQLDGLMRQTWPNTFGRHIGIDLAAIDGNAWTEDVWEWARRHPKSKLIMVRGANSDTAPRWARVKKERNDKTGKLLRYAGRFYNFGSSVMKMGLYRDLEKDDALGRGYVAFPRGLDDEYFRQLTSERRTPIKKNGFVRYYWTKDETQANEALDNHLQAETAAGRYGVRGMPDAIWDRLEQEREVARQASRQGDLEDLLIGRPSEIPAEAAPAVAPRQSQPVPQRRRSSRSSYMG